LRKERKKRRRGGITSKAQNRILLRQPEGLLGISKNRPISHIDRSKKEEGTDGVRRAKLSIRKRPFSSAQKDFCVTRREGRRRLVLAKEEHRKGTAAHTQKVKIRPKQFTGVTEKKMQ